VLVLLDRPDLDDAREVDRDHGGDVGDAEAVRGDEVAAGEAIVQIDEELLQPGKPALGQLGDLRDSSLARAAPVRHGRCAVAHRLGDRDQALESMRQFQLAISAFSPGVLPSKRGSGKRASR
jgi:hypothetical protein